MSRGRMESAGKTLRAQLTSHSPNKMSDFSSSLTLLLLVPISGSHGLSDLEPIFFYCIKMHWMLKNGVDHTGQARLQITSPWCKTA